MLDNCPNLFLEINGSNITFVAGKNTQNFEILSKTEFSSNNLKDGKLTNYEELIEILKDKIYLIENKVNFTFKEIILIINHHDVLNLNLSGYKKLNGSQLTKENVTYILNSLKSSINNSEKDKSIIHIFNSKFFIDKSKTDNLPIGLFGNIYSHELSCYLIDTNVRKNFENILNECNLKIKKIFLKSFIGSVSIAKNDKVDSFFKIEINKEFSQLIFFDNSNLRFSQDFKIGSDIIIKDISKVISLDVDTVKEIVSEIVFDKISSDQEILEEKFFKNCNFRKIKKKLIYEIAASRIEELAEIFLFKNVNIASLLKRDIPIFLFLDDKKNFSSFKKIFKSSFSNQKNYQLRYKENHELESLLSDALKIAHFGWKNEAVPIVSTKKTAIRRFFEILFK